MSTTSNKRSKVVTRIWVGITLVLVITLAVLAAFQFGPGLIASANAQNSSPTTSAAKSDTDKKDAIPRPYGKPAECSTWRQGASNYADNRWFGEGIREIKEAETPAQASNAADAWMKEVRKDDVLLAGAAQIILNETVDSTTFFQNGCATDAAVQLSLRIETDLTLSDITVSNAPNNGHNTGVENGTVVGSTTPGVNGDTKAIQIVLPDGRTIWIMARCGNIVTSTPPPLPPGCVDEG